MPNWGRSCAVHANRNLIHIVNRFFELSDKWFNLIHPIPVFLFFRFSVTHFIYLQFALKHRFLFFLHSIRLLAFII